MTTVEREGIFSVAFSRNRPPAKFVGRVPGAERVWKLGRGAGRLWQQSLQSSEGGLRQGAGLPGPQRGAHVLLTWGGVDLQVTPASGLSCSGSQRLAEEREAVGAAQGILQSGTSRGRWGIPLSKGNILGEGGAWGQAPGPGGELQLGARAGVCAPLSPAGPSLLCQTTLL